MSKGYLIAFAGKPAIGFLDKLREVCVSDGCVIEGAILTDGPGCRNLAFLVDAQGDEDRFSERLCMALQPAKYETCDDPRLVAGQFLDDATR